jgi:hypothetical protein
MGRFLIFYRLIGAVLFELTQLRPILLIFPNTFEYFFIFYEALAVRWNPARISKKFVVGVTAFIWIFIKLPQEYWLHIAKMDATEFLNTNLLGEPANAPIIESFLKHPEILIPILATMAGLILFFWWVITNKLPVANWKMSFSSKAHIDEKSRVSFAAVRAQRLIVSREEVIEKTSLLTLVVMIFGQILPGRTTTGFQLILGVIVVVLLNTLISYAIIKKGKTYATAVSEFFVMGILNMGLAIGYTLLLPRYSGGVNIANLLFLVLLITTLLTLYDRYRPIYEARFLTTKK